MAEEKKEVTLDEDTYNRMLRESQTPAAPVYDDSARQKQNAVYGQIANRGPFQYDLKNDPLYGMYRDRYVQNGRMAMKDTMGQAAALTGGYGSSYGQAVGQQQYDAYLQGLTDVIPELYGQAYQQYQDEGDRLMQQYQMLGAQADAAYNQYRDRVGDWQYERAWQEQKAQTAYARQQDAFSQLYSMIGATGYVPTAEELEAAGMSQEAADALRNEYLRKTGQLPAPGGSGRSGGGGTYTPTPDPDQKPDAKEESPKSIDDAVKALANAGATKKDIYDFLKSEGMPATPTQRPIFPFLTGWMK